MYNFTAQLSGALHFENHFLALAMMGLKRLPCAGTRIRLGACLQMLTYETITVFNMWCGGWEDGGFLSFILSKAIKAYPGDFPKKGKKDPYVISGGVIIFLFTRLLVCIAVQAEGFVNSCLSGTCSTKLSIFYQQPRRGKGGSEIMNTHFVHRQSLTSFGLSHHSKISPWVKTRLHYNYNR